MGKLLIYRRLWCQVFGCHLLSWLNTLHASSEFCRWLETISKRQVVASKERVNIQMGFRPNKKISVFRVTGLKILGRIVTHIFFNHFFFWKKYIILCILKGISPFKMHKLIYFGP